MTTIDSHRSLFLFNSIKAYDLFKNKPGVECWSSTRKIWGLSGSLIDRSGVVTTPFKTETLEWMKIPKADNNFSMTLEDCCFEHAREIIDLAVNNKKEIALMYSGGIDSTCALVSLLQVSRPAEKELITVLLNKDSILENPVFYKNFLLGKIKCKDSNTWENYVNDKFILVTGEGGDQLFSNGFTRTTDMIFTTLGWDTMRSSPNPDLMIKIFKMVSDDYHSAKTGWERVVEPLIKTAVVPIDTIGQALWYFHFTCKWQNVYLRIFNNLIDTSLISNDYVKNNFKMFYQTDEIQKWILKNNEDAVCVSRFVDIKRPLKEIIFNYDKNETFLEHKTKIPSLGKLCRIRPSIGFITNNWQFLDNLNVDDYYNTNNNFI